MSRRTAAFVVVVALQALLPLLLIGWNEVQLARGTDVVLKTVPVDPIDLVRGRYVALRYDISSLPAEPGTTVYVPLRRAGDHWTGASAVASKPSEGVFIRGRSTPSGIVYGIETYYADEDEARSLERVGELLVHVSLDDDGKARIESVEVR